MIRLFSLLLLVLLTLVGCGATPATPAAPVEVTRVVEITREVEVTREVEIAVEVTRVVIITATPAPSATPSAEEPTPTVESLATTLAVTTPEGSALATCWPWEEAHTRIGEAGCVEGTVTGVGGSESASFINFSPERDTFYLVSFDWTWEEIEGECVRVEGTVSEFRGRPQIIIDEPTQLRYCDSTESPPAFRR